MSVFAYWASDRKGCSAKPQPRSTQSTSWPSTYRILQSSRLPSWQCGRSTSICRTLASNGLPFLNCNNLQVDSKNSQISVRNSARRQPLSAQIDRRDRYKYILTSPLRLPHEQLCFMEFYESTVICRRTRSRQWDHRYSYQYIYMYMYLWWGPLATQS